MAILSSEKLSLEIRFREIDAQQNVQYDTWIRYDGKAVINPGILKRDDAYWNNRISDGLRASDGMDDRLIPTLQEALETNQPRSWQPVESGFSLYVYPEIFFPPTSQEDFERPFRLEYFPDSTEKPPEQRSAAGGKLPNDLINIYVPVDLFNFSGTHSYGGTGLAMHLCVYRWEVEDFLDDLKYEYAELLRRYPQRQEDLRAFQDWHIPFDPQCKPLEVYFFQGDMPGWIHINLTVDGLKETIWTSHVFPPFDDLVDFLTAVARRSIPAHCMINEEGHYRVFRARSWTHPDHFRFEMVEPDYPHFHTLMDYVFERKQFVLAFYNDLVSFMTTHFNPSAWGDEQIVSLDRMENLRAILERWD